MSQIIANVPVWVWPLFIGLVFLGLRASKDRNVPLVVIYLLPLLGCISINTLLGLPNQTIVWCVYVVVFCFGGSVGYRVQARWIISYLEGKLLVRGEWFTLTTMMIIFVASFVNGALNIIAPPLVDSAAFIVAFVGILAVSAGFFAGRAVKVITYVRAIR